MIARVVHSNNRGVLPYKTFAVPHDPRWSGASNRHHGTSDVSSRQIKSWRQKVSQIRDLIRFWTFACQMCICKAEDQWLLSFRHLSGSIRGCGVCDTKCYLCCLGLIRRTSIICLSSKHFLRGVSKVMLMGNIQRRCSCVPWCPVAL